MPSVVVLECTEILIELYWDGDELSDETGRLVTTPLPFPDRLQQHDRDHKWTWSKLSVGFFANSPPLANLAATNWVVFLVLTKRAPQALAAPSSRTAFPWWGRGWWELVRWDLLVLATTGIQRVLFFVRVACEESEEEWEGAEVGKEASTWGWGLVLVLETVHRTNLDLKCVASWSVALKLG